MWNINRILCMPDIKVSCGNLLFCNLFSADVFCQWNIYDCCCMYSPLTYHFVKLHNHTRCIHILLMLVSLSCTEHRTWIWCQQMFRLFYPTKLNFVLGSRQIINDFISWKLLLKFGMKGLEVPWSFSHLVIKNTSRALCVCQIVQNLNRYSLSRLIVCSVQFRSVVCFVCVSSVV